MVNEKEFIAFLAREDNIGRFEENLWRAKRISTTDFIAKRKTLYDIINNAFDWGTTHEGHGFWSDLNAQWNTVCSTGTLTINECKSIW